MITQLTLKRILVKTRLLELPVYFFKNNYLYNFIRFGVWTKKYIPENIYLETTNACNAKCYSCPRVKMNRPIGIMHWDIFEKIINSLKPYHGLYFTLHIDGEPLLDPDLFKRIKYIKKNLKNPKIHFNTNVVLMNEEKIKNILDSGLDSITFSVDGTTKETYEKVKTGLKFEEAITAVTNFFKIKKETKSKKPLTIMQMVTCDDNKHQVEDFKKQWKNKADKVFIKAMLNFMSQGTSIKTKKLTKKQQRRCFQPIAVLPIYWDGTLGLCCWDYDHLAKLNSDPNKSVIDLFNDEKHNSIRQSMLKMDCSRVIPCNICSQIYGADMNANYK
ncbi:MAG: radical SAM protein [Patescibacteria group bacterium]